MVVKNGSNTRSSSDGAMPSPVSDTSRHTMAGISERRSAARTRISPPAGIASRAFTNRFISTCSSCPGSAHTRSGEDGTSIASAMDAGSRRRQSGSALRTSAPTSIAAGVAARCRPNAKSCRTSAAARIVVSCARRSSLAAGDSAATSANASSTLPRIAVSRLLKSCAIPPARCPSASSFCDCSNCSRSMCSRSARAYCSVRSCQAMTVILRPFRMARRTCTAVGTGVPSGR